MSAVGVAAAVSVVWLALALFSSQHATAVAKNQASTASARDQFSSAQWSKAVSDNLSLKAQVADLQAAATQAYNCVVADGAVENALVNRLPTADAYAKAGLACQGIIPRLAKIMG